MSHTFKISGSIRRLLFSWLTAVTLAYILLPRTEQNLSHMIDQALLHPVRILTITVISFVVLSVIDRFFSTRHIERWGMVAIFALLSGTAISANQFSLPFLAVSLFIEATLILFAIFGWNGSEELLALPAPPAKGPVLLTTILALCFFVLISLWGIGRVFSFSTPTYDFGIFAQMFHSMKTNGLPMTTLERDGLLSHFHVHVSPIYYLMLPFYCLAPHPATLQLLQAAVITSAIIPLWMLGTRHGLSGWQRALLCASLLCYPAFAGGVSFDLHENCFLTPLILWLFLGIDRRCTWLTALSSLLILGVKEDAAVYVAILALWLIVRALLHSNRRDLMTGLGLFVLSLLWFLLVTDYLAEIGDGVMTYRYKNLMPPDSESLLDVVLTALLHPMKVLFECVDPEKIHFIALTMLPLLGLPLLTRRYERFLLLIPYLLINLMPDYVYQHDIYFQYTFGSLAFLFYLVTVNLGDMKGRWRTPVLVTSVTVCALLFGRHIVPRAVEYPISCFKEQEQYREICQLLDTIPADASVTAGTFQTTYLSHRDVIYDIGYASRQHLLESEYVVIDLAHEGDFRQYATGGKNNGYPNLIRLLHREGYKLYGSLENKMIIFQKSS